MDEFDKNIVAAKPSYQPTNNFTEDTMNTINEQPVHQRSRLMLWLPLAAGGVAVIALLVALPLHTRSTTATKATPASTTSTTTTTQPETQTPSSTTASTPVQTSDLDQDMNGVDSSMSQAANDQASADNGLDDSSHQINVPTN